MNIDKIKISHIILYTVLCITLCACSNSKKETDGTETIKYTCTGSQELKKDIIAKTEYEITSTSDNNVSTLVSTETIKTNDKDYLNEIKESIEETHSIYKDIKNYKNTTTIIDDELISITKIDYDKIDMKEFVKIDKANNNIISNNKVNLNLLKGMYESLGNTCIKEK